MSSIIGGIVSLVLLLGAMMLLTNTVLGIGISQQKSLDTAARTSNIRLRTSIGISEVSVEDQEGTTDVTAQVCNNGSVRIVDMSEMDVFVSYPDADDNDIRQYLEYTSGTPGNNQWTVSSISPDTFNENIWDPDETVTLGMVLSPEMKDGKKKDGICGVLLLVTPTGITDSFYFDGKWPLGRP